LVIDVELTKADGYAEQDAAVAMLERSVTGPVTADADRAYDTRDFVWDLRALGLTSLVAQNECAQRSAIVRRTPRHPGCRHSQRRRKMRHLGRARNKLWIELDRRRLPPHPSRQPREGGRLAVSPTTGLGRLNQGFAARPFSNRTQSPPPRRLH